jgi:hypothetical protein
MLRARNLIAACAAALAGACASAPPAENGCAMSLQESSWVKHALDAWRLARTEKLRVDDGAMAPTIVFYNEAGMFTGEGGPPWRGAVHNGVVTLPDGNRVPPQVASFASPYADNTRVFFTMALPSVWQVGGIESGEFGLDNLTTAVLIHEITHTRQFASYTPRMEALDKRYDIGAFLTDDIVQDTFSENAGYVATYEAERDLIYHALAASSDVEARAMTGEALARMRTRQMRYFAGVNEKLIALDDIFLTMEGIAQWAAYSWLVDENGGRFAPDVAVPGMRRGGRQWSQDEGMAIFLLIDRLVPGWQARAFAAEPATAMQLLALAANGATR